MCTNQSPLINTTLQSIDQSINSVLLHHPIVSRNDTPLYHQLMHQPFSIKRL